MATETPGTEPGEEADTTTAGTVRLTTFLRVQIIIEAATISVTERIISVTAAMTCLLCAVPRRVGSGGATAGGRGGAAVGGRGEAAVGERGGAAVGGRGGAAAVGSGGAAARAN